MRALVDDRHNHAPKQHIQEGLKSFETFDNTLVNCFSNGLHRQGYDLKPKAVFRRSEHIVPDKRPDLGSSIPHPYCNTRADASYASAT